MFHLLRATSDLVGNVGQQSAQLRHFRAVEFLILEPLIYYRLCLVKPQATALEQVGAQLFSQIVQQCNALLFDGQAAFQGVEFTFGLDFFQNNLARFAKVVYLLTGYLEGRLLLCRPCVDLVRE